MAATRSGALVEVPGISTSSDILRNALRESTRCKASVKLWGGGAKGADSVPPTWRLPEIGLPLPGQTCGGGLTFDRTRTWTDNAVASVHGRGVGGVGSGKRQSGRKPWAPLSIGRVIVLVTDTRGADSERRSDGD